MVWTGYPFFIVVSLFLSTSRLAVDALEADPRFVRCSEENTEDGTGCAGIDVDVHSYNAKSVRYIEHFMRKVKTIHHEKIDDFKKQIQDDIRVDGQRLLDEKEENLGRSIQSTQDFRNHREVFRKLSEKELNKLLADVIDDLSKVIQKTVDLDGFPDKTSSILNDAKAKLVSVEQGGRAYAFYLWWPFRNLYRYAAFLTTIGALELGALTLNTLDIDFNDIYNEIRSIIYQLLYGVNSLNYVSGW